MIKSLIKFLSSFLITYSVEERKSGVSSKLEVLYTNGKYVLDAAHVNYSFGGLHKVFQKAFGQLKIREREIKNALILGFGSGSVASILQEEYKKDIEIIGVEKDEAVIDLSKKYFSINKYKKLSLYCNSAYDFVENTTLSSFDLIVVDIFVDLTVPENKQSESFIFALNKLLSSNGILFYNFIVRDEKTRDRAARLYKKMNMHIGPTDWIRLPAKRTENWMFVCDRHK